MKSYLHSFAELWYRGFRIIKAYGVAHFTRRAWNYLQRQGWRSYLSTGDLNEQYQRWLAQKKECSQIGGQISAGSMEPKISVLLPVSNGDTKSLEAAVQSVLQQSSSNWELCIVIDATAGQQLCTYLEQLTEQDQRIVSTGTNLDLAKASSEYVLFMDPDDFLHPQAIACFQRAICKDAELDLLYADEDRLDEHLGRSVDPLFKPEWSPHLLHSFNYVGHPLVMRKQLAEAYAGKHEHDMLLRLSELSLKVKRIPEVLCSHRGLGRRVDRNGADYFRVTVRERDPVSIIIPTKNNGRLLKRCIDSIESLSTYSDYELIIIDNGSTDPLTLEYLGGLAGKKNTKVLPYPGEFNYPLINNFGAANAVGRHLVFLNDDTEVIAGDWLEAMLAYSQRPEVGAVGALLLFPNGLVQHAGIVIGMRGSASHAFYKSEGQLAGNFNLIKSIRNVAAVTAACMMIKAKTFASVGGFDPKYRLGFNDVDLCLRLLNKGLYNVYTPHARLIHHESLTRGEFIENREIELFNSQYHDFIRKGDPYYHPALSLERNDYSLAV